MSLRSDLTKSLPGAEAVPNPAERFPSLRAKLLVFKEELARRPQLLIAFIGLNLALYIQPLWQTFALHIVPKDYHTWWVVGQGVLHGAALYPPHSASSTYNYFYPPAIATLFYAPLSLAGPAAQTIILLILSSLGYLLGILLSIYLATGVRKQPWALYVIPACIAIPFAYDIFFMGQLNMTMLALMLFGFVALDEKKSMTAGVLFALCAAAKAFPFTIIGYLLWRRYFKAAAAMLVALAIILVLLPAPFRGFDRNWQELGTWTDHMLLHNNGSSLANQPDRGYRYGNQALISVVNRLTRPLPIGKPKDGNLTVNFITLSATQSFLAAFALIGALSLAFVLAMPPKRLLSRPVLALEGSIVLLFIIIFSPKADTCYFCWIIPGFTVAIAAYLRSPAGSARRRWIATGLAASILVFATALTQNFTRVPQGLGATMWGGVILSVVLIGLLWSEKKALLRTIAATERTPRSAPETSIPALS